MSPVRSACLAGLGLAACAAPAAAQALGQGQPAEVSAWRVVAALGLCLALALGGALALRARLQGGGRPLLALGGLSAAPSDRLALAGRLRLSPQVEVCLVRCDARDVLLAVTPTGASLLCELPPPADGEVTS